MTINAKLSVFLRAFSVLLCVAITSQAQTVTEYYRTYDDFLKKRSTPLVELRQPPFIRVTKEDNRINQLIMVDSTGVTAEKREFSYDKTGNLNEVAVYNGQNQLRSMINYQPDSVQSRLIAKLQGINWVSNNEACYTDTYFDSVRNPIEQRVYAYNGYLIGIIALDYNQNGHLVRESIYAGDSARLIEYTEFSFIMPDSIQTVRQYDGEGRLKSAVSLRIYK